MTAQPVRTVSYVLGIEADKIPELLRQQSRWLAWKAGPLKPNGKFDKFPVDPNTGRKINGRDPAQWLTFAAANEACRGGLADGIGFALSDQHPLIIEDVDYYVAVADFDQCAGAMEGIVGLWRDLGSPFMEVSPSSNGLHIWGLIRSSVKGGNAGNGRELYSGGRFVTMTGVSARGVFGECRGLIDLEKEWFPAKATLPSAPPAAPLTAALNLPSNVSLLSPADTWFDRLSATDKNACLTEMLRHPRILALADTSDDAPYPNWRTVLAACARSGASNAYALCRVWAQTSSRFCPDNFDLRWRSYARG